MTDPTKALADAARYVAEAWFPRAAERSARDELVNALAAPDRVAAQVTQSELRSIQLALCSADVLNKFAALARGCYEAHVHNTIEAAICAINDDAGRRYVPPFEGDPKDCAFAYTDDVCNARIEAVRGEMDAERAAWMRERNELVARIECSNDAIQTWRGRAEWLLSQLRKEES